MSRNPPADPFRGGMLGRDTGSASWGKAALPSGSRPSLPSWPSTWGRGARLGETATRPPGGVIVGSKLAFAPPDTGSSPPAAPVSRFFSKGAPSRHGMFHPFVPATDAKGADRPTSSSSIALFKRWDYPYTPNRPLKSAPGGLTTSAAAKWPKPGPKATTATSYLPSSEPSLPSIFGQPRRREHESGVIGPSHDTSQRGSPFAPPLRLDSMSHHSRRGGGIFGVSTGAVGLGSIGSEMRSRHMGEFADGPTRAREPVLSEFLARRSSPPLSTVSGAAVPFAAAPGAPPPIRKPPLMPPVPSRGNPASSPSLQQPQPSSPGLLLPAKSASPTSLNVESLVQRAGDPAITTQLNAQVLRRIVPNRASERARSDAIRCIHEMIRKHSRGQGHRSRNGNVQVYAHGSFASKTYIPSSGVDVAAYFVTKFDKKRGEYKKAFWAQQVAHALTQAHSRQHEDVRPSDEKANAPAASCKQRSSGSGGESSPRDRGGAPPQKTAALDKPDHHPVVADVDVSHQERMQSQVLSCTIDGIRVRVSLNRVDVLESLLFVESVDRAVGREHLFKRTLLLFKAWARHEAEIMGPDTFNGYILQVIAMTVFNARHSEICSPAQGLVHIIAYLDAFDWRRSAMTLYGPVPLAALQSQKDDELVAPSPRPPGHPPFLIPKETLRRFTEVARAQHKNARRRPSVPGAVSPLGTSASPDKSTAVSGPSVDCSAKVQELDKYATTATKTGDGASVPVTDSNVARENGSHRDVVVPSPRAADQSPGRGVYILKGGTMLPAVNGSAITPKSETMQNPDRLILGSLNIVDVAIATNNLTKHIGPIHAFRIKSKISHEMARFSRELKSLGVMAPLKGSAPTRPENRESVDLSRARRVVETLFTNTVSLFGRKITDESGGAPGAAAAPSNGDATPATETVVALPSALRLRGAWGTQQAQAAREKRRLSREECLETDVKQVQQNLAHAKQFQSPHNITESQLVAVIAVLLDRHGKLPIGALGRMIRTAINSFSLPAVIQDCGGIKAFLVRHSYAFVLGENHPNNPLVHLNRAGVQRKGNKGPVSRDPEIARVVGAVLAKTGGAIPASLSSNSSGGDRQKGHRHVDGSTHTAHGSSSNHDAAGGGFSGTLAGKRWSRRRTRGKHGPARRWTDHRASGGSTSGQRGVGGPRRGRPSQQHRRHLAQ